MSDKAVSADLVIAKYIELRDRRTAIKREYEDKDRELVALMAKCEHWLQQTMNNLGVDNISSKKYGTAYQSYQEFVRVEDWDSFLGFIQRNEAWHLLNRAASKTGVKELMAPNNDGGYDNPPPPGINFTRVRGVTVRRS